MSKHVAPTLLDFYPNLLHLHLANILVGYSFQQSAIAFQLNLHTKVGLIDPPQRRHLALMCSRKQPQRPAHWRYNRLKVLRGNPRVKIRLVER